MSKLRKSLVKFIYEVGNYSGCHQMPERSFFYHGRQFPVCARCTGVVIGQTISVILNLFTDFPMKVSLAFLVIMGVDWSIQEIGLKKSTNLRRVLTGVMGGFGLFNIYAEIIKRIVPKIRR